jgi:hypothetical protein
MHALAGHGSHKVRDEGDVLDIVHDKPTTSTHHIYSATGGYSLLDECYGRLCTTLNFSAVVRHDEKLYAT